MGSQLKYFPSLLRQQFTTLPYPTTPFTGQTVIVTGANSGLGLEACRHFVRLGAAKVIMACRDVDKGQTAAGSISGGRDVVEVWQLDLSSFDSVKSFAHRAERLERVDALVSNAGVALGVFVETEGYESCITVNVISTFLLMVLMLPKMRSTAEGCGGTPCVSVVSSDGHLFAQFPERDAQPSIFYTYRDPNSMTDDRYNTSKLLGVLLSRELARQLAADDHPVVINTVVPGFVRTQISRNVPPPGKYVVGLMMGLIGRTAEMGSRTLVHAAGAGRESHGRLLASCQVSEESVSEFAKSEEGKRVGERVFGELMGILEVVVPGVQGNVTG